jgi:hypothetical protein
MTSKAENKNIDETNYQETARAAVEKYADKGMILDSLFWGRIIRLYERDLAEAHAKIAHLEGND